MTFKAHPERKYVPIPRDSWSDDSSFIGSPETKAQYEAEVKAFDPRDYWDVHAWSSECIAAQQDAQYISSGGTKRKRSNSLAPNNKRVKKVKSETPDRKPSSASASTAGVTPAPSPVPAMPFNPYEDDPTAYQLHETLDEFFDRLRPSKTSISTDPWIWIANPYSHQRPTQADVGGFKQKGENAKQEYLDRKAHLEKINSSAAPSAITRKLKPYRDQLEAEIARLAKHHNVTSGKWMLFPLPEDVDYVWKKVATGVLQGKLGSAAKVATYSPMDPKPERLICVYTDDFSDKTDVERVLLELNNLGLVKDGARQLYYKADAYTHLDLVNGNEFKLKASMYSSNEFLGGDGAAKGKRKS